MLSQTAAHYHAAGLFKNGHFNTIYGHFFGQKKPLPYYRETLKNKQGFSLYLDWMKQNHQQLIIFSHGLESSSYARYITTMGQCFFDNQHDVLAWNCRNCAENAPYENKAYYHSGISEDLNEVIEHVLKHSEYQRIVLVGFSMGGNILLKYLGEKGSQVHPSIAAALAVSAPVDLMSCSFQLLRFPNQIYGRNFLKSLLRKIADNPEDLDHYHLSLSRILKSKNLRDFDQRFTAHVHGFENEDDYYLRASSLPLLKNISIPCTLLNALDDPFLAERCYPLTQAINNPFFKTIYPKHGGHLGFNQLSPQDDHWLNQQALNCLLDVAP